MLRVCIHAHPQHIFLLFSFLPLLDDAVAVGIEELLQVVYLSADVGTLVGVGDTHAVGRHLHDLCGAQDVGSAKDGIAGRGERLMLHQFKPRL